MLVAIVYYWQRKIDIISNALIKIKGIKIRKINSSEIKKDDFIRILANPDLPDILVMDVWNVFNSKCFDGLEIIQKLKSNKLTKNIPICVFSSFTEEEDKEWFGKIKQAGADYVFSDLDEMRITVQKICNTK